MKRKIEVLSSAHFTPALKPIFVGCFQRRLDVDRRLRLPAAWRSPDSRMWLIYPRHLHPANGGEQRELTLLPILGGNLRARIPAATSASDATLPPTFEALFEVLQGNARKLGQAPDLVTLVNATPDSARFALTKTQLDWLGSLSRKLVIVGTLTQGRICTPKVWAEWEHAVNKRLANDEKTRRRASTVRKP